MWLFNGRGLLDNMLDIVSWLVSYNYCFNDGIAIFS